MAYTNSPLATYTRISPNRNSPRNQPITKITVHHMAGIMSVEQFGALVANPGRQMSSNYAIGNDGRIGLFCPEQDRSWCSSSPWNDNRAITIEVSNSAYGDASGWPIGTAAYNSLIKLCADICKRNGIKKLYFTGNSDGTLTYHYMFNATSCLPIDRTELLTPSGWKLLKDIHVGDVVATVHIDNLSIKFDGVENIVPVKTQDTYRTRDFEATSDHRVVYYNQAGRQYVGQYKDLYDLKGSIYLPNAGFIENPEGFGGLGSADIEFLVAVQADGHYMTDGECCYGIEFHLKKERKIKRLKKLFEVLGFKYTVCEQTDGTKKLRLYGADFVHKCEEYLNNKCFTWDWLNMNRKQVEYFMDAILQYDGCEANKSYASSIQQNVDIVQAIAAINGIGTKMTKEHDRVYFKKYMRSLGDNERQRKSKQQVSCVTVRSGFILIRQHGRTTITGNCPGPWMKAHTQDLCDKVNALLNSSTEQAAPKVEGKIVTLAAGTNIYDAPSGKRVDDISVSNKFTIVEEKTVGDTKYGKLKSGAGWVILEITKPTTNTTFKVGDLVKINSDAVYYNGGGIPEWVKRENWYIAAISNDRAVLGLNEAKNRNIQSPINTKYLTLVTAAKEKSNKPAPFKEYRVSLKSTDLVFITAGGATNGTVGSTGVFTIVEDRVINGVTYGKLKSGLGWVVTKTPDVKKGDRVKIINPIVYGTNKKFTQFVSTYWVLEVNGDRVVISSDGKNITTAISKSNIRKV